MNQTRPPHPGYASYPADPADAYYRGDEANVYSAYPDSPASPYGLVDDGPQGQPAPARKVRTTLGRAQGHKRPRPVVAMDPNARMVSAFRPSASPGAHVRVVDDQPPVQAPAVPQSPSLAYLRPLVAREPLAYRLLFVTIALAFTAACLATLLVSWAPADAGAEQHAALVAGRLLAEQGDVRLVPADPFAFVGEGWVATEGVAVAEGGGAVQEYAPTGPIGLPVLYAALFRFVPSHEQALVWAHLVTPISAALAVLGMFFLARFAGGSFLAALAMVAMAAGLLLPGGAASAGDLAGLALATWGFALLIGWWRRGSILLGLLAGLLVGCAFTVSYIHGLLAVPLIVTCVFAWQWRRPLVSGLRILVPIVGSALPVAGLLYYNHQVLGAWTGHHLTGEAALFDADNVVHHWQPLLGQLSAGGLYFLLPLGLVGVLTLCARRLPLGLMLLCWLVLPILAYAAYGWPDTGAQALPLLLMLTPVVLFGAAYLLRRVLYAPSDAPGQLIEGEDPYTGEPVYMLADPPTPLWRSLAAPVAAGLVVAVALGVGADRAGAAGAAEAEVRHAEVANLAALGDFVRVNVPAESVLFVDVPLAEGSALHHLDAVGNFELYDAAMFSQRFARRLSAPWTLAAEAGQPTRISRDRYAFLHLLYEGMQEADVSAVVHRIVDGALNDGREAFLLMNDLDTRRFEQAHLVRGYQVRRVGTFHAWPPVAAGSDLTQAAPTAGEWSLVIINREPQVRVPGDAGDPSGI